VTSPILPALLQDFQHVPLVPLGPAGVQNGSQGGDRPAVLPNDLPDGCLRHPHFDDEEYPRSTPLTRTYAGWSTMALAMSSMSLSIALISPRSRSGPCGAYPIGGSACVRSRLEMLRADLAPLSRVDIRSGEVGRGTR
jgi:hypothetical protein